VTGDEYEIEKIQNNLQVNGSEIGKQCCNPTLGDKKEDLE
jgi:hypothetical protein